jgi:CRISPR-associated protein Csm1
MLILATISGIQEYLFDVRETGGGQARSLRFRSFRIQMLAEAAALRLLEAAALPPERILYSAAAKFCIDAGGLTDEALQRVRRTVSDLERGLLKDTHGRLRLAVVLEDGGQDFTSAFEAAGRRLALRKMRPGHTSDGPSGTTWPDGTLRCSEPYNPDAEAASDEDIGRRLTRAAFLAIRSGAGTPEGTPISVLSLTASFESEAPGHVPGLLSVSNLRSPERCPPGTPGTLFRPRRLARHVPTDARGHPIEFEKLAAESRGAPMLGVLKADVDSLGQAIGDVLGSCRADGAKALAAFSDALDRFFSETLQQAMSRNPWNLIYTVFAGGDDMLLVGPWSLILDFAGHARRLFAERFGRGGSTPPVPASLTFSAGIAIIKPRYPLHLAVQQADGLLAQAKTVPAFAFGTPKDQCAALGGLWKWADHKEVIGDGRRLADWVDAGVIQRGWLHTLLELTRLRRGEAGPVYRGVHPAVATSRLAYHVARNWPGKRDKPRTDFDRAASEARAWIDAVLAEFDITDPAAQQGRLRHLPVVVRYALLATRSGSTEDRP